MRAIFCETHNRFEMMTYTETSAIALNEDVPAEHHFADPTRQYVHAGPKEQCKVCQ